MADEFPQELAFAVQAALDAAPGRPVLLLPEVIAIRGRVSKGSDRVESVLTIEAEFDGQILSGSICFELDPDEAAHRLKDHRLVLLVRETLSVEPLGLVILGDLALPQKGAEADAVVAQLRDLVPQFVELPLTEAPPLSRVLH